MSLVRTTAFARVLLGGLPELLSNLPCKRLVRAMSSGGRKHKETGLLRFYSP